ncbi:MAG: tetratricopeptide repeat protein, partial [Bacteroidetes bacterium]|nr:tetratricopeptide repeat protein [Bacteroidota bacterium]
YLKKGEFETAIDYLKDFSSDDVIIGAMAFGATGDAYSELGQMEEAVKYYEKAAAHNENNYTTPMFLMKAGNTYEELGNIEKALEIYKRLKTEFVRTQEGREAEKYYARAIALTGE